MSESFDPYHKWLGIPPEEQPPNHYRLLGIADFESDPDVIEAAADQRMAHLRTYQTGSNSKLSQVLLNEVSRVRVCLLNSEKKTAYDEQQKRFQMGLANDSQTAGVTEASSVLATSKDAGNPRTAWTGAVVLASILATVGVLGLIGAMLLFTFGKRNNGELANEVSSNTKSVQTSPTSGTKSSTSEVSSTSTTALEPEKGIGTATAIPAGQTDNIGTVVKPKADNPNSKSNLPVSTDTPKDTGLNITKITSTDAGQSDPKIVEDEKGGNSDEGAPITLAQNQEKNESQQPNTKKYSLPSDEQQQSILRQIKKIYDFSAAKLPEQKSALAKELIELAADSRDNPNELFVLLRRAMDLAREAGNAQLMLEAIQKVATDFDVDSGKVTEKALIQFARDAVRAEAIQSLVEVYGEVADRAIAEDRFDEGESIVNAVYAATQRPAGRKFRKLLYDHRKRVSGIHALWKEVRQAQVVLDNDADNAQTNLVVGKWYCFYKNDWQRGLPHLAKGSDLKLSSIAKKELGLSSSDSNANVEVGDAWYDMARTADETTKTAMFLHSQFWYKKAEPGIKLAIAKAKVTKRLEEIAKLLPASSASSVPEQVATKEKTDRPKNDPPTEVKIAAQGQPKVLTDHVHAIYSLAFSPDNKKLISGGGRGIMMIWDVASGRMLQSLKAPDRVFSVTFSPDGKTIASGHITETVMLWDSTTGKLLKTLTGLGGNAVSVKFSPDGKILAAGTNQENTVTLWDVASGDVRTTLVGHSHTIRSVAFSPDGKLLASASYDKEIKLWDVGAGKLRGTIAANAGLYSVVFSPNGEFLVSAGHEALIKVWDVKTGRLFRKLGGHDRYAMAVAFSPNGQLLTSAGVDRTVRIWNTATGQNVATFLGHESTVRDVAFSPDGKIVASASEDKTIRLWHLAPTRGKSR